MAKCILKPENECTNCGACDERCTLDPSKICDNCFKCLEQETEDYAKIPISAVYTGEDYVVDAGTDADAGSQDDGATGSVLDVFEGRRQILATTLQGARAFRRK